MAMAVSDTHRTRPTTASSLPPAARSLPNAWLEQLADGGRLVAPLQGAAGQALLVIDRRGEDLRRVVHDAVHFVPLKSGVA